VLFESGLLPETGVTLAPFAVANSDALYLGVLMYPCTRFFSILFTPDRFVQVRRVCDALGCSALRRSRVAAAAQLYHASRPSKGHRQSSLRTSLHSRHRLPFTPRSTTNAECSGNRWLLTSSSFLIYGCSFYSSRQRKLVGTPVLLRHALAAGYFNLQLNRA
jgi:hypothetical protein